MDFQTAVRTCLNKYVTIEGRARRSEYWWFVLFNIGGGIILSIVDSVLGIQLLNGLWTLALLLPSICVGVRRLHDRDMSGWWLLLGFIPVIGAIILIVWFASRGTAGPNRFGSDPLDGDDLDAMHEPYARSSIPPVDND